MADWLELAGRYCQLHRPKLPSTQTGDLRLGHLLSSIDDPLDRPAVALLGFPSDEGIRRNGGRAGARGGPAAIRQCLYRMTTDAEHATAIQALLEETVDLGDMLLEDDVELDQNRLGELVGACLEDDLLVVILGGGHEVGYGHFLGYVNNQCPVQIINIDAHADVRPLNDGLAHSGSPFRQALEHPSELARRYHVYGLQPQSNSAEQLRWLQSHRGSYLSAEHCTVERLRRAYPQNEDAVMATFCLDALDQSLAPGVSAPSAGGLDMGQWLSAVRSAAANPRVRSFDFAELSPEHDRDQQTARLAAVSVWNVLRGLALR
jgi:formiminoglutamase